MIYATVRRAVLISTIIFNSISPKIIMWDLGNVLFGFSTTRMIFHVGIFRCIGHSSKEMRTIIADILGNARKHEPQNCSVPDDKGSHLSNLLCDYQAGVGLSENLLQEAYDSIEELDARGYFVSKRQKRFTQRVIKTIFQPSLTAQFMRPIKKGAALLKECAEKTDIHGNRCHEMVVLSNWDAESFKAFKEKNKKIFNHFSPENIIISASFGHHKGLKPSLWLFQHMIEQKGIPASEFIFLDDQPCNIAAAQACGMHAILVDGNYKKVHAELQRLGAL